MLMALPFPGGFPVKEDFPPDQVHEEVVSYDFAREAGSGGQDYGVDLWASNGSVVVGWDINEIKSKHTKGDRDLRLLYTNRGPLRLPTGAHNGIRLTPLDNPLDPLGNARYKGDITLWTVREPDWYAKLGQ
jgi:hypothetical protein